MTSCTQKDSVDSSHTTYYPSNTIDYRGTPDSSRHRSSFVFSDIGAWFAYGFPTEPADNCGFSGPYLLTQENGVWCSKMLSKIELYNSNTGKLVDWNDFEITQKSYNSHLEQDFENEHLKLAQKLIFSSAHSALIVTEITNLSDSILEFIPTWKGATFLDGLKLEQRDNTIQLISNKSDAKGLIQVFGDEINTINVTDSSYTFHLESFKLKSRSTKQLIISQSFIFPENTIEDEQLRLVADANNANSLLQKRIKEKQTQLETLYRHIDSKWTDSLYKNLIAKTVLTLQNNWRISAGELSHSGVFPSYHYKWFHGFWAWDSWKHAVAIAQYDTLLATEQIKAMYDFQTPEGFIPDCIYRDTTIERHNYRNTKPPLSGWAVWKVYEKSKDEKFLKEVYPKIVKQHQWWYEKRDHDHDGLCEYGSTDGTLIAAKWESGMDNAVRFDKSKIIENSDGAYSLDQESVDLNAYLFAEKKYLIKMAVALGMNDDAKSYENQTKLLKEKIQNQFFDPNTGWFYDTSLDGEEFILEMGCEGWIPLWAEVATKEQVETVKNTMMNPECFNTKVPFQTLSANHSDFEPDGGYWRGPNWIDQSYFGIMGLHNYGYHEEAYAASHKLMHHAEGLLVKGRSIRENYHPLTGNGLESENFSWSAAHYLLLLLNE